MQTSFSLLPKAWERAVKPQVHEELQGISATTLW